MISYQSIDVSMPRLRRRHLSQWIKAVAAARGKKVGEVAYVFCSDEHILEVNRQYLHHDYFTDIITFDYSDGDSVAGDIFISLDTVRSNAALYSGGDAVRELHRVIIHGVLHLLGLKDKDPEDARQMRAAEDEALALLDEME